jgi:hypothetical protein
VPLGIRANFFTGSEFRQCTGNKQEMMYFVFLLCFACCFANTTPKTCVVDTNERVACKKLSNKILLNNGSASDSSSKGVYSADNCLAAGCCWMRIEEVEHSLSNCFEAINSSFQGYELTTIKRHPLVILDFFLFSVPSTLCMEKISSCFL